MTNSLRTEDIVAMQRLLGNVLAPLELGSFWRMSWRPLPAHDVESEGMKRVLFLVEFFSAEDKTKSTIKAINTRVT